MRTTKNKNPYYFDKEDDEMAKMAFMLHYIRIILLAMLVIGLCAYNLDKLQKESKRKSENRNEVKAE